MLQASAFFAMFFLCASMCSVFLVYILLLCYAGSDEDAVQLPVMAKQGKGLAASDLEKLPKINGGDLVLGTDCAVCLDEIESDQTARMIPGCNHGFHLQCADAWLSRNSVCPVCRAKVGPEFFSSPDSNPC